MISKKLKRIVKISRLLRRIVHVPFHQRSVIEATQRPKERSKRQKGEYCFSWAKSGYKVNYKIRSERNEADIKPSNLRSISSPLPTAYPAFKLADWLVCIPLVVCAGAGLITAQFVFSVFPFYLLKTISYHLFAITSFKL